ncbi:MAG: response regulator transcription factor [Verrucomicrobiota bacterium]
MKLFIADDSILVRKQITEAISDLGGIEIVGEAGDVDSSLTGIRFGQPHVVLLDLCMPGGTGLDVLTAIKREIPEIVFIIYTQHSNTAWCRQCLDHGADLFLGKETGFAHLGPILENLARHFNELQPVST